jgi:pseudaminic acid synthase
VNKSISISGRKIGLDYAPYIIAELSANHNGDLDRALRTIEMARAQGADAIKIQTYTAETMTIDCDKSEFQIVGGLWDGYSLYKLYQWAQTPFEWHKPIFDHARRIGITLFSTPFDETAVDLLENLNAPAYKIASFEVIDLPLIKYVAQTKKPMIISTGMANLEEISEAVEVARSGGCADLVLLHCISSYPAPIEQSNLKTIRDLSSRFDVVSGLSDHTMGTVISIAGVASGASVIEKHVTLSKQDKGPDSEFSLEPEELRSLCVEAKSAWLALGKAGYERKPAEEENVKFRRSLYVVEDIKAGEKLTASNIRRIRPGFGLSPKYYERVIGCRTKYDLHIGDPLGADMIVGWSLVKGFRGADMPCLELDRNSFLRPISEGDVTVEYVEGLNRPEVNRFLVAPRRKKQTRESVGEYARVNWEANDAILFGLFVEDKLRGTLRLHDITSESAFIGIVLFEQAIWGWGSLMISAVTNFAMNDLGLKFVRAGIEWENIASQKAFAKAGFHALLELDSDTGQIWECASWWE